MNNTNTNLKIFLSYHKPCNLLKSTIFEPIHVGRDLALKKMPEASIPWMNQHMIGDNTGNNISNKNPNFCELTAQYWAWKNCTADYIGFMHYRRHLNFNENIQYKTDKFGLVNFEYLDDFYKEALGLLDENIISVVKKYDIITTDLWDVTNVGSANNYEHYKNSASKLHIQDYDKALSILLNKYPEYKTDIDAYNISTTGYYTNIFIMKKDIFENYCTWLFSILFELEKQCDISNYDFQEARIYGYISEWLFGIYIFHLKRTSKLKIKELQRSIVNNTEYTQDNNAINICFSSDKQYLPHLSVAIASLLKNAKTNKDINIYILHNQNKINKTSKQKIINLSSLRQNTQIHFINVCQEIFKNFPLNKNVHFTIEAYYRYIIPKLLNNIDKCIYLDCDLVVKGNIANLYNTDISTYCLGMVQDLIGFANQTRLEINKTGDKLYCNSGVLLMNLDRMRHQHQTENLIEFTNKNPHKLVYFDQDAINIVLEDEIKYLDLTWNLQYYMPDTIVDYEEDKWKKAINSPQIIHFIGCVKPWHKKSNRPFTKEYYKYLKLTPYKKLYYKYLWNRTLENIFSKNKTQKHKIIKLLGFKFKIKRKNSKIKEKLALLEQKTNDLTFQLEQITSEINSLKTK